MKMELTQCSETSAIKHHTPGNNPKDYMQQIRRWQLQNKRAVNHYEVSKLFGNAHLEVQTGKIETSGFRAADLHPMSSNVFEDVDFDAVTEEHSPCAGALLSRKESATQESLNLCFRF
jgi:hypothetical protein